MAKYCANCGSEVNEEQNVCLNCGTILKQPEKAKALEEGSTGGWGVLSFFFPLIGLILGLVWKEEKPKASKTCLKWALIGFLLNIVLTVLYTIALGSLM